MHKKRTILLWWLGWVAVVLLAACAGNTPASQNNAGNEQNNRTIEVVGRLGLIHGGETQYRLYGDDGVVYRLEVSEALLQQSGGVLSLQHGKIRVKGYLEDAQEEKVIHVLQIEKAH